MKITLDLVTPHGPITGTIEIEPGEWGKKFLEDPSAEIGKIAGTVLGGALFGSAKDSEPDSGGNEAFIS